MLCENCKQEFKVKRSIQQNKYLHKCFSIIAEHTGYSLNEIKVLMKHEFGYYEEVHNKKTGETLINYLSTADMSKKEFAEFTEKVTMFANSHGLKILSLEEYYES
jgi:hypothetical protein